MIQDKQTKQTKKDPFKLPYWKKVKKYFDNSNYEDWDEATKYALDVFYDRKITSKMVKYATARHLLFLYKQEHEIDFPYEYDDIRLRQMVDFAKKIDVSGSKQKFIFMDFRKFIAGFTFGWFYKEDRNKYMTDEVFDVEARKQGKSSFWSMVLLSGTLNLMATRNAEVYICGPVKESSKTLYAIAKRYVLSSPKIRKKFLKVNTLQIESKQNSTIKALPFEDNVLEGKDPSIVVLTEYHMHPDDPMQASAKRSYSAFKKNMLIIYDTTKGEEINSVCFERERRYKKWLEEQINNPETLHPNNAIFLWAAELDEQDIPNWQDTKLWIKSNPMLDDLELGPKLMRELVKDFNLIETPTDKISFMTKRLGIWAGQTTTYFNYFEITESNEATKNIIKKHVNNDFKDLNAIIGVDLSSNLDTTSLTLLFQIPLTDNQFKKGKMAWVFKSLAYIPHEKAIEKEKLDKVPYRQWRKKGYVNFTSGKTIDYNEISEKIIEWKKQYNVIMIGYDPWNFNMMKNELIQTGYFSEDELVPIRQGVELSQSFKLFDNMLKNKKINFLDNEITYNHIQNVAATTKGPNENIIIKKASNYERIDNFMAMLNAVSLIYKVHPEYYEMKPIRVTAKNPYY